MKVKQVIKIGIDNNPESKLSEDSNVLVAYFSWSGTSERIAKNIITQTGADSFRIERETPYSNDYSTVAYGEAKDGVFQIPSEECGCCVSDALAVGYRLIDTASPTSGSMEE